MMFTVTATGSFLCKESFDVDSFEDARESMLAKLKESDMNFTLDDIEVDCGRSDNRDSED